MSTVRQHPPRLLGWSVVVLSVAVVIAAIAVVGSPREVRARKTDQQRVSDLTNIRSEVQIYYNEKKAVPASLDEVEFAVYDNSERTTPRDPVTQEPYRYEKTGDQTYRLRAVFESEARTPVNKYEADWQYPFSRHKKGEQWFELEVDKAGKGQ